MHSIAKSAASKLSNAAKPYPFEMPVSYSEGEDVGKGKSCGKSEGEGEGEVVGR